MPAYSPAEVHTPFQHAFNSVVDGKDVTGRESIGKLGARPTTRQMAQLLAGEGFAVSHVQVFKDYRTLKNKS